MVPISLGSRGSAFTASKTEGTLGCHGNQGVLSVPVRYYLGRFFRKSHIGRWDSQSEVQHPNTKSRSTVLGYVYKILNEGGPREVVI